MEHNYIRYHSLVQAGLWQKRPQIIKLMHSPQPLPKKNRKGKVSTYISNLYFILNRNLVLDNIAHFFPSSAKSY